MSPNPSGANGITPPAYGDVKKQLQLSKQAPLSGAPIATAATEAPRRAQRKSQRDKRPAPPTQQELGEASVQPQQTPSYDAQLAAKFTEIAGRPGAQGFPLIQEYAVDAQSKVAGG